MMICVASGVLWPYSATRKALKFFIGIGMKPHQSEIECIKIIELCNLFICDCIAKYCQD